MQRHFLIFITMIGVLAASAWANVSVSSPANNSTVGSPVQYIATASTSTCSSGVASMGVYVDNHLTYVVNGASMNTSISVASGSHDTVVEEWDHCGGATFTHVPITVTGQTGVVVNQPANNSTVSSPVQYVATATTTCGQGVASMGIYVDNQLISVVNGASMNTSINVSSGPHNTVVEEWDRCGGASFTPVKINVGGGGGGGGGKVLSNIQASGGWKQWGELPPVYDICPAPCNGVTFWMKQGVTSPSRSGNATEFFLGGSVPYSDVLFSNPLLGQGSTQGLPDSSHTLLPTIHNFTYDAYFFSSDISVSQVLEFDVSMYFNGLKLIWGQQCRVAGGHEWDIWDNPNGSWVPTGAACNPVSNGWNHVTIQMQRLSNNWLLFQSITLNGVTANINRSYAPASAPSSWWGVTVNYQMDGNHLQAPYSTYLDNFSLTYW